MTDSVKPMSRKTYDRVLAGEQLILKLQARVAELEVREDDLHAKLVRQGVNFSVAQISVNEGLARVKELEALDEDMLGALRLLVIAKTMKDAGDKGDAYQQAKAEGWKAAFRIVNERDKALGGDDG